MGAIQSQSKPNKLLELLEIRKNKGPLQPGRIERNVDRIIRAVAGGTQPDFNMMWEIMEKGYNDEFCLILDSNEFLVHLKDSSGTTLLMKSVELGNLDALRALLEHGSPVNEADNRKFTALHYAVSKKSETFVKILLKYGADVEKPLSLALEDNNPTIVQMLSPKVYLQIKSKRIRGLIVIRISALNDLRLLQKLLELKEYVDQIDAVDQFGKTALMYACERGLFNIVKTLLRKASMYVRDKSGRDAFFFAALKGFTSIVKLFQKHEFLLKHVNLTDQFGLEHPNALFAAFKNHSSNFELIQELIAMSSKDVLDCTDVQGNTLLHLAVEQKQHEIMQVLLEARTSKYLKNANGEFPYDIAVKNRDLKAVQRMKRINGSTLESDIHNGKKKEVLELLECGHKVEMEHIYAAIDSSKCTLVEYDNDIFEQRYSGDLWESIFGILLSKINQNQEKVVSKVVSRAVEERNFQFIQQIYDSEFKDIFLSKIKKISKKTSIHVEMQTHLKRFTNFEVGRKVRITLDNEPFYFNGLLYSIFKILNDLVEYDFHEFLYCLIKFRMLGYNFDEFSYNAETILEFAIKYFRMDTAMALLTFGVRPKVKRQFEEIIEDKFNDKFKKTYEDFQRPGLKSLEEFARIAARSDVQGFKRVQDHPHLREKLLFNGARFYEGIVEVDLVSVLVWLSNFGDNHEDKKGIAALMMSEIAKILAKTQFTIETMPNKIFLAINRGKCKDLKKSLTSKQIKFNDIYLKGVYALHYAIALGRKDMVECFLDLGYPKLLTNNNLFTCVDIAKMFEQFSIVEYLVAKSGFEDVSMLQIAPEVIKVVPINEFLFDLFDLESNGLCLNNYLLSGQILLKSILELGREDLAVLLVLKRSKLTLKERLIEFTNFEYSNNFNKLYEECKINGFDGLNLNISECFITIYKDGIQTFKFQIKMIDSKQILYDIMVIANRFFITKKKALLSLLTAFDKSFLSSLFHSLLPKLPSYESKKKIYKVIKSGDLKKIEEIIRLENINVNQFYLEHDKREIIRNRYSHRTEELNIFHYSIVFGNLEVVELILKNGAVNLPTKENSFSCVELAEIFGHDHIAQYLAELPKFAQYQIIPIEYVWGHCLNSVEVFYELYANKYTANDYLGNGQTVLQTVVEYRKKNITTLLLQKGGRPILEEKFEMIIRKNFGPELKNLYEECKNVTFGTLEHLSRVAARQNSTLFHQLWKYRCFRPFLKYKGKFYKYFYDSELMENYKIAGSICPFLSELSLHPQIASHDDIWRATSKSFNIKSPPLFSAIREKNVKEIRRLIEEEKVSTNSFFRRDVRNAFHYAISLGEVELVKLLLEYGALERPILTNKYFVKPVYCAELADFCGHYEIVKLLSTRRGFKTIKNEVELKFLDYHYSILERMEESKR